MIHPRRVFQPLTAALVERSLRHGENLAAHYRAGGSPRSRERSGYRGTENNVGRLAQGKAGECALALFLGLDPMSAVNWRMVADNGTDIVTQNGARCDAKTTFPHYRLIWSNNVNDLYASKVFDVLFSVSIDHNNFENCWIEGYIPKRHFIKHKHISDGSNGLEPNTWFMEKHELYAPRSFFAYELGLADGRSALGGAA